MDYQSLFNDTQFHGNLSDDAYGNYTNISYDANEHYTDVSVDPDEHSEEVADEFDFLKWYRPFFPSINGYLSLTVCFFGTIANIMNIIVLTSKKMKSPFNAILLALAFSDLILVITDLVWIPEDSTLDYLSHFKYSYPLTVLERILQITYDVFRSCSVWLTVVAAIWRVMAVSFPHNTLTYRSLCRARVAIVTSYAAIILICIPEFIQFRIEKFNISGVIVFFQTETEISKNHHYLFTTIYKWTDYIMFRYIPCILLIGLTAVLIRSVRNTNKNRQNLNLRSGRIKAQDRTTTMLIIVLIIFLLTHGVQPTFHLIYSLFSIRYVSDLEEAFTETFYFFIRINSSINFFVYLILNSQFRETFKAIFLNPFKNINCNRVREKRATVQLDDSVRITNLKLDNTQTASSVS